MKKIFSKTEHSRGFTLVELIVVIAIIALLSSVVIAGVDIAKYKARDAAIVSSVQSYGTALEQEFLNAGNYGALLGNTGQGVWIQKKDDCESAGFTGQFDNTAKSICRKIIQDSAYPNQLEVSFGSLFIGPGVTASINPTPTPRTFTIMVYLPGIKKFYCYGHDGKKSMVELGDNWTSPGCWGNY